MIVYSKVWLDNLRMVKQLKTDQENGFITTEELSAVKQHYPVGFYMPNIAGLIGFFILTLIVLLLSSGLLSLVAASGNFVESPYWWMFLGICCYAGLEVMTKVNNYFHSGIDNAMLYYAATLMAISISWITDGERYGATGHIVQFFLLTILFLVFTLRFADAVMAAGAGVCLFALVYFMWAKLGSFGLATMPFMMMIASAGAYLLLRATSKNEHSKYYETCTDVAKMVSLLTLYLAGNYFVVNRLNNLLHGLSDSNTQVQMGWFFWLWIIILPPLFIAIGVHKKNRILLRLGMLLCAAAVATFRNYYHLLPTELMLTIAGGILLLLAYTVIQYLKKPRYGITYAEPTRPADFDRLNAEGFIIGQAAGHLPNAPVKHNPFGGGTGGGAGSSGSF